MKSEPKICVKCRWYADHGEDQAYEYQRHWCYYPRGDIDLVTGEKIETPPKLCRYARANKDDCGEEGRYWES